MTNYFTVLDDSAAVAVRARDTLRELIETSRSEDRRACIALSGGSTPALLFDLLAREPAGIDVNAVDLFFGDERTVPPDHPDSNYHLARTRWFDHVRMPPERVHRMPAERDDLEAAAQDYARTIADISGIKGSSVVRRVENLSADGLPIFDLIWLGLGSDGHTASLFPGTTMLTAGGIVCAGNVPQLATRRMTLTLDTLNAARHVQFLVTGESKRGIVASTANQLDEAPSQAHYPAARVRPQDGKLEWLLDRAAAQRVS